MQFGRGREPLIRWLCILMARPRAGIRRHPGGAGQGVQAEPTAKADSTPEPASEEGHRQETWVSAGPEHLSNARSHVQVRGHRGQMCVMVVTGFSCLLGSAVISQGRGLAQPNPRCM